MGRLPQSYLDKVVGNMDLVGVPPKFRDAELSLDLEPGNSYFIYGEHGVGKTWQAVGLLKECVRVGVVSVRFTSVPMLLLTLRDTYGRKGGADMDTSDMDIVCRHTGVGVLLLDDLGAEKASDWSLQMLYMILDGRYAHEMPTVITSNLSPDKLAAKIGDRIVSRVMGMCEAVEMDGPDRRVA